MSEEPSASSPSLTASERAALYVREELQLSGERDRLKERLQHELRDRGWHQAMHEKAAQIARARLQQGGPLLTARELARELSQFGRESIPEQVRANLMADLLQAARDFAVKTTTPDASHPTS